MARGNKSGKKSAQPISAIVWVYIAASLASVTATTMLTKAMFMENLPTCDGCPIIPFNHPYMQTLFMFIGEFFCLFIWIITEAVRRHKGNPMTPLKEGKVYYKFWPHVILFAFPTIFDLVGTTMFNIANYYSDPSVYAILTNCTVIFVALISICLFKDYRNRFDLPQLGGLIVLFLGASIIALGSILIQGGGSVATNPGLGIIFTILGCFVVSWFYLAEEISLRKVQTVGFMGVANEGGWGLIFCAIALPILNIMTDPLSTNVPKSNFEDLAGWAYQLTISKTQVVYHIVYPICVLIFNFCGMEITNHASAATRTTFGSLKPIFVWIMSISVGWEPWHNTSTPVKWAGFIVVTVGVLIFNNVLKLIPYLRVANIQLYGKWMGKGKPPSGDGEEQDPKDVGLKETIDHGTQEDEIILAVEEKAGKLESIH